MANGSEVQLIYAGANSAIDPPNSTGQPTGDDTIIGTCAIGDGGYDDGLGFFSCNNAWSGSCNTNQYIYVRAFNNTINNATYFGNSYLRLYSCPPDTSVNLDFMVTNKDNSLVTNIQFAYSPTAVELISFNATGIVGGIKLDWATGTEIRNLGFNIYRSTVNSGGDKPRPYDGYVRINKYLIAGLGTSALGSGYEYVDYDVEPGTAYFYILEDVEFNGATKSHGPVSAASLYVPGTVSNPVINPTVNAPGGSNGGGNQDQYPPVYWDPAPGSQPPANGGMSLADGNKLVLKFPGLAGDTSRWKLLPFEYVVAIPDCGQVKLGSVQATDTRQTAANVEEIFGQQKEEWNLTQGKLNSQGLGRLLPGKNNKLKSPLARISDTGYLRGQRIAVIKVNPVQPGSGAGWFQVSETIEIELVFGQCRETVSIPGSDLLGSIYEGLGRHSRWRGLRRSFPLGTVLNYLGGEAQWKLITASGQAVKLGITEDGICRVPLNDLGKLGLRANGIRVFYEGKEIPVEITAPDESSDRDIQKRLSRWQRGSTAENLELRFAGRKPDSKYTSTSVYWIIPDRRMGLTLPRVSATPAAGLPSLGETTQVQLLEENRYYFANMPGGDLADHWYWDSLVADEAKDFALEIPDPVPDAEGEINLSVIGLLDDPAIEKENHLRVELNRVSIGEMTWGGRGEISASFPIPAGIMAESGNTLNLVLAGDTGAGNNVILLNSIEITYLRALSGKSGKIRFQVPGTANVEITGFAGEDILVYRLGARANQARLVDLEISSLDSGYLARFRAEAGEYLALNGSGMVAPTSVKRDVPSQLKRESNEADLIIVGPQAFQEDLLPLVSARMQEGLRVSLVDVEDVYDEFNYGELDPRAIRDFLSYAYHNWTAPPPAFVLLAGDASYDFKDYMGTGKTGVIPAPQVTTDYLEFTGPSDNWYACVDGADEVPDLAIGRLPARTPSELKAMVAKILARQGKPLAGEEVLLSADNDDPVFEQGMEAAAAILTPGFDITRAYLGSLGLETTRQMILNSLQQGVGIFEYAGHSAIDIYAQEDIFGVDELSYLSGNGKTFLAAALGCLSGYFDVPYLESLGEEMVRLPGGGAFAGLFSSGFTYPEQQIQLNNSFLRSILAGERLGSSFLKAKLEEAQNGGSRDILRSYHLFGDPSARLE